MKNKLIRNLGICLSLVLVLTLSAININAAQDKIQFKTFDVKANGVRNYYPGSLQRTTAYIDNKWMVNMTTSTESATIHCQTNFCLSILNNHDQCSVSILAKEGDGYNTANARANAAGQWVQLTNYDNNPTTFSYQVTGFGMKKDGRNYPINII